MCESLKALMCEQNFSKISVQDICHRAGVTRRNFYRHFLDKYDLLCWIYQDDFQFDFEEHPDWTIVDYLPLFCQKLYQNKDFYLKAYQVSGQNGFREYCYHWLFPLIHRGHESDALPSLPVETEHKLSKMTVYMTFDSFIHWLKSDPCPSPDEFARSYFEEQRIYSELLYHLYHRPFPTHSLEDYTSK